MMRPRSYSPLLRRLARHFRVTVVDLLPRLTASPPWLMGHSDSGAMALLVAAWCPARVRGLVLADTVGARRKRSVPRVVAARLLDALLEPGLDVRAGWHLPPNVLKHPCDFFTTCASRPSWMTSMRSSAVAPSNRCARPSDHSRRGPCWGSSSTRRRNHPGPRREGDPGQDPAS
jgi:pimeloyl-ACP methyl ester carboxylesterase